MKALDGVDLCFKKAGDILAHASGDGVIVHSMV